MTRELRDFAESILRSEGERLMWWERSQELAKKCDSLVRQNERLAADVATLTAERDKLAARVVELEAKLGPVAPVEEVDSFQIGLGIWSPDCKIEEVDGFRVGDLVRYEALTQEKYTRITGFINLGDDRVWHASLGNIDAFCVTSQLIRKPVEVGDTVRTRYSSRATITQGPDRDGRILFVEEDGKVYGAPLCTCIAVAP